MLRCSRSFSAASPASPPESSGFSPWPVAKHTFGRASVVTLRIAVVSASSSRGRTRMSSGSSTAIRSFAVRKCGLSRRATMIAASLSTRPSLVTPSTTPNFCCTAISSAGLRSGSIRFTSSRAVSALYAWSRCPTLTVSGSPDGVST